MVITRINDGLVREDLGFGTSASLGLNYLIKDRISNGEELFHFGFGESPFPVPLPFLQGLIENAHKNEYLNSQGLSSLRQKIIHFHKVQGDFDHFTPNDVVLAAGSKELIYHMINVFNGDILLPSPCWMSYAPQSVLSNKSYYIVQTDSEHRYIPTARNIETTLSLTDPDTPKLLILNFPGNPTGQMPTEKQLIEIRDVCRKNNTIILSDEIYARLAFKNEHISMSKVYPEGTVVTSGFSKWASMGGWRAGYALFPSPLANLKAAVISAGSHSYSCQAVPIQYALNYGMDFEDELVDYIDRSKIVLEMCADYTHRELTSVGVKGHPSECGYYFMPDFEVVRLADIPNGTELSGRLLNEAKVAVMPCDPDFMGKAGELTARLAFINFKGAEAMQNVSLVENSKDFAVNFLDKYCQPLTKGVQATKKWVMENRSNIENGRDVQRKASSYNSRKLSVDDRRKLSIHDLRKMSVNSIRECL